MSMSFSVMYAAKWWCRNSYIRKLFLQYPSHVFDNEEVDKINVSFIQCKILKFCMVVDR